MDCQIRRREALKLAAWGAAGGLQGAERWAVKPAREAFGGLKVGLASYSTRKLTLEETLKALAEMSIHFVSLKDMHLPLSSSPAERQTAKQKVADAGLKILGCGVISLKNDEAEIRRALEYTRDIGAPTAVVAPDPSALPALDRVVKDFDLRVAIHNHGPEDKKFPSPLGFWNRSGGWTPRSDAVSMWGTLSGWGWIRRRPSGSARRGCTTSI